MNKKILKTFIGLACFAGVLTTIPFVSTSCGKKYGEDWICSFDGNSVYQHSDTSEIQWLPESTGKFYFGESNKDNAYRELYTIHSENGINIPNNKISFQVIMELPTTDNIPGGYSI